MGTQEGLTWPLAGRMLQHVDRQRESLLDWATKALRDSAPHAELRRLGAPASRTLAAELAARETVRVVVRGTRGQAIVGTDRRVLVLPPVVPGEESAGPIVSCDYLDVLGVEVNEQLLGGSVVLRILDGRTGIPAAGDWDAIRARVATLRGLVAGAHSDSVPAEVRLIAL
jgi:hypothetical protein